MKTRLQHNALWGAPALGLAVLGLGIVAHQAGHTGWAIILFLAAAALITVGVSFLVMDLSDWWRERREMARRERRMLLRRHDAGVRKDVSSRWWRRHREVTVELHQQMHGAWIEVSFDPEDASCVQVGYTGVAGEIETRLRLRARNTGVLSAEDVSVKISVSNTPFNPTPLSVMHGGAAIGLTIHPGAREYIDTLIVFDGEGARTKEAVFCYGVNAPNTVPRRSRDFDIEVTGRNINQRPTAFSVAFDEDSKPSFRYRLPPDDAQPEAATAGAQKKVSD